MITLNLLGAQRASPTAARRLLWAGPLVLAIAVCSVHGLQARRLNRLTEEVETLKSRSVELSRRIDDANRRARAHSELAARLGLIDKLGRNRGRALELLARFGAAVSEQMWLLDLSYSNEGVTVSGLADTAEEVAKFLGRVDSLGAFATVDLVELKREAAGSPRGGSPCRFTVNGRFAVAVVGDDKATHADGAEDAET